MRYAADHKPKTRERVLAEAARALRADGPDRVSVATVMKRAGLTHGGFYAHFRSKDALLAAAIGHMFATAHEHIDRTTRGREPAAALAAYVDWYLSPRHRDARADGCPVAALAADLPRMSPRCRAAFASGVHDMIELFAKFAEHADLAPPDAVARSLVAELCGAVALARAEPASARSSALLAASRGSIYARLGLGRARRSRK